MRKLILAVLTALAVCNAGTAQNDTMYVMKAGVVINKYSVKPADVDSVVFYKPVAAAGSTATVTDYEGNVYKTVTIGTQVWMAENLKSTKYADGTPIPLVSTTATWDALTVTSKAYCWYNNAIANKPTYGALYTWAAAMNGAASVEANTSSVQGVCPTGWHLPSDAEWMQLSTYLGGRIVAGGKLKETGTTHWESPNTSATNETGFTARPGGYRLEYGTFSGIGNYGDWWSASESNATVAWIRSMLYTYSNLERGGDNKEMGISVRCIKD